jgi:PAS domain S-box-containing protein
MPRPSFKAGQQLVSSGEWKIIRSLNIRQSGFKHHMETKAIRKDGTIIDVDLSVNILKDDQGKIVGSVGMLQDITERKRPMN